MSLDLVVRNASEVDGEIRTPASREHRGCFGRFSGGYGAIIHAMSYPQYWGAIGNRSASLRGTRR